MGANKTKRNLLIHKYGNKCFIEELGLRTEAEIRSDLKRYKSKKQRRKMNKLTYHHIIAKCKGGETTEENGALLRYINHIWLHSLPAVQQKEINQLLLQYKLQYSTEIKIEESDNMPLKFKVQSVLFKASTRNKLQRKNELIQKEKEEL